MRFANFSGQRRAVDRSNNRGSKETHDGASLPGTGATLTMRVKLTSPRAGNRVLTRARGVEGILEKVIREGEGGGGRRRSRPARRKHVQLAVSGLRNSSDRQLSSIGSI